MATPNISFEFFPPQTLDASFRLWETAQVLAPLQPSFVSVTYGAGGTTRKLTHEAVTTLGKHYNLNVAAHLTCVEATRAETKEIIDAYAEAGVTDIVALRGDAPQGRDKVHAASRGLCLLRRSDRIPRRRWSLQHPLRRYPEPHPEATDALADVRFLKRKQDAGATSAITQFFFEAETFFRFRDACDKEGITAKIIPGILPIQSWAGARRFAERCGTSVPAWVIDAFEAAERDGREDLLALSLCTELCDELIRGGVEDLQFYTLNRPTSPAMSAMRLA